MSIHFILRALLTIFVVVFLAGVACIMPWITTLGFISTEYSSEVGYDGASIFHSGLPFRFLTRDNISIGMEIDSLTYWFDVVFWFLALLYIAGLVRYRFRRARTACR